MNVIYEKNMPCSPFIISQIGETQNEMILAPLRLVQKKDEFFNRLFLQLDIHNIRKSFYRTLYFCGYIVVIHYWLTREKEVGSERDGLYVLCGALIEPKLYTKSFDIILFYVRQFYDIVSYEAACDYNSEYSDILFNVIQKDSEILCQNVLDSLLSVEEEMSASSEQLHLKKVRTFGRSSSEPSPYKRIMLFENTFENILCIFMREGFFLFGKKGSSTDLSSIKNISPYYIEFLVYGEEFPENVNEVCLEKYSDLRYLILT